MAGTQAGGGKEGEARGGLLGCRAACGRCGRCLYWASSVGQGQRTETTFLSVSLCLNHLAKGGAPMLSFQGLKPKNQDQPQRSSAGGKGKEGCIDHISCARYFIFIVRFRSCSNSMR